MPYPIPFYMRVGASNALTHAELDSNQKILSTKIDLTVGNNLGNGAGIYLNKVANANDGFLNFRTLAGLSGTSIFISGDTLVFTSNGDFCHTPLKVNEIEACDCTSGITVNTNCDGCGDVNFSSSGVTFNYNSSDSYTFPCFDGAVNYVLCTDGYGNVNWCPPQSGSTVSADTFISNFQLVDQTNLQIFRSDGVSWNVDISGVTPYHYGEGTYAIEPRVTSEHHSYARGDLSNVQGGYYNIVDLDSNFSFIGGGFSNDLSGSSYSLIVGGEKNDIIAYVASGLTFSGNTLVGGSFNRLHGVGSSFIGGGLQNKIQRDFELTGATPVSSLIVGGEYNIITGETQGISVIVGGKDNVVGYGVTGNFIGGGAEHTLEHMYGGYGTIVGGYRNVISGDTYSAIVGGQENRIDGDNTEDEQSLNNFIGGGKVNQLDNTVGAAIVGGFHNFIQADAGSVDGEGTEKYREYSFIGAGEHNQIQGGTDNVIVGGHRNIIQSGSSWSSIIGGSGNTINHYSNYSFIGGGTGNTINHRYGFIGGGQDNSIYSEDIYEDAKNGWHTAIVSGRLNQARSKQSIIGAGYGNIIGLDSYRSAIISGRQNLIFSASPNSLIGVGANNVIYENNTGAAIVGGQAHQIYGGDFGFGLQAGLNSKYAFIGGGYSNEISGYSSTIVAGINNEILSPYGFIGAGTGNFIHPSNPNSSIVGGQNNEIAGNIYTALTNVETWEISVMSATSTYCFIGGGYSNLISGYTNSIVGGLQNQIIENSSYSTIGGGNYNKIKDGVSDGMIGGGMLNTILGAKFSGIVNASGNTVYVHAEDSAIIGGSSLIATSASTTFMHGLNVDTGTRHGDRPFKYHGAFAGPLQNFVLTSIDDDGTAVWMPAPGTTSASTRDCSGDEYVVSAVTSGCCQLVLTTNSGSTIIQDICNDLGPYQWGESPNSIRPVLPSGVNDINFFDTVSDVSGIMSGRRNTISGSPYSFIGGGNRNMIDIAPTDLYGWNAIVHGSGNRIQNLDGDTDAFSSLIVNGDKNIISGGTRNTILNGLDNRVGSTYGTVLNGAYNLVNHRASAIVGGVSIMSLTSHTVYMNGLSVNTTLSDPLIGGERYLQYHGTLAQPGQNKFLKDVDGFGNAVWSDLPGDPSLTGDTYAISAYTSGCTLYISVSDGTILTADTCNSFSNSPYRYDALVDNIVPKLPIGLLTNQAGDGTQYTTYNNIAGGYKNKILTSWDTTSNAIVNGLENIITGQTSYAISGGYKNFIAGTANSSVVLGQQNLMEGLKISTSWIYGAGGWMSNSLGAAIHQGLGNQMLYSDYSSIINGYKSKISGSSSSTVYGLIGNGYENIIESDSAAGTTHNSRYALIGNGIDNVIWRGSGYSTLLNGAINYISGTTYASILNGKINRIFPGGSGGDNPAGSPDYSTIVNGTGNTISGEFKSSAIIGGVDITAYRSQTTFMKGLDAHTDTTQGTRPFRYYGAFANPGLGKYLRSANAAGDAYWDDGDVALSGDTYAISAYTSGCTLYISVSDGTILTADTCSTFTDSPYRYDEANDNIVPKLPSVVGQVNSAGHNGIITFYNNIAGGNRNKIWTGWDTASNAIVNGSYNVISGSTSYATLGGHRNFIEGASLSSFAHGGYNYVRNSAYGNIFGYGSTLWNTTRSAILGGNSHTILKGWGNVIGGGIENVISGRTSTSNTSIGIASGYNNLIVDGNYSTGGGTYQTQFSSVYSFIGGGIRNNIWQGSVSSSILGGGYNYISGATNASILSGRHNIITPGNIEGTAGSPDYAAIVNGSGNTISLDYKASSIIGGVDITASRSQTTFMKGLEVNTDTTEGDRQFRYTGNYASPSYGTFLMDTTGSGDAVWTKLPIIGYTGVTADTYVVTAYTSGCTLYVTLTDGTVYTSDICDGFSDSPYRYDALNENIVPKLPSSAGVVNSAGHNGIITNWNNIAGGSVNKIWTGWDTFGNAIVNGTKNVISGQTSHATVGGDSNLLIGNNTGSFVYGTNNFVANSNGSSVGGGATHLLYNGIYSTIAGGWLNTIIGHQKSFIGGGQSNVLSGATNVSTEAFIGAGHDNQIHSGIANEQNLHSSIVGGWENRVWQGSSESFIGGGRENYISGTTFASILNGKENRIFPNGKEIVKYVPHYSAIVNGSGNTISYQYNASAIIGGVDISATKSQTTFMKGLHVDTDTTEGKREFRYYGTFADPGPGRVLTDVSGAGDAVWQEIGGPRITGDTYAISAYTSGCTLYIDVSDGTTLTADTCSEFGSISPYEYSTAPDSIRPIIPTQASGAGNDSLHGYYHNIAGGNSNTIKFGTNLPGRPEDYKIYNNAIINGETNTISGRTSNSWAGGNLNLMVYSMESEVAETSSIFGYQNYMEGGHVSSIVNGYTNSMVGAWYSFMGSGRNLQMHSSSYASIVGGKNNEILGHDSSFIGGGQDNILSGFTGGGSLSTESFIGSGHDNQIHSGHENEENIHSSIVGGWKNRVWQGSPHSFIGGGEENYISGTTYSSILNGEENRIFPSGTVDALAETPNYSAILNGSGNTISGALKGAAIIGGVDITGSRSQTTHMKGLYADTDTNDGARPFRYYGAFASPGANKVLTSVNGAGDAQWRDLPDVELTGDTYAISAYTEGCILNVVVSDGTILTADTCSTFTDSPYRYSAGPGNIETKIPQSGQQNDVKTGYYSAIMSGKRNTITGREDIALPGGAYTPNTPIYCFIGSGNLNRISGFTYHSTILGGVVNDILESNQSTILSGYRNRAEFGQKQLIGGGQDNFAQNTVYGVILNGFENENYYGMYNSVINGTRNAVSGTTPTGGQYGHIANGYDNKIFHTGWQSGSWNFYATVLNGSTNNIWDRTHYTHIGNGYKNQISGATYGSIHNGKQNFISGHAIGAAPVHRNTDYPTILNGSGNTISAYADASVILGGVDIHATTSQTTYMKGLDVDTDTTVGDRKFKYHGVWADPASNRILTCVDNLGNAQWQDGNGVNITGDSYAVSAYTSGCTLNVVMSDDVILTASTCGQFSDSPYRYDAGVNNIIPKLPNSPNQFGYNIAIGGSSAVLSGVYNGISGQSTTVVGGEHNEAGYAARAFIGGGYGNKLVNSAGHHSSIVGGIYNEINSVAWYSSIVGGVSNKITGAMWSGVFAGTLYSSILGGEGNLISGETAGSTYSKKYSVITGGKQNKITEGFKAFIGNGLGNEISSNNSVTSVVQQNHYCSILNGQNNRIISDVAWHYYGHILGGSGHTILSTAHSSAIIGATDLTAHTPSTTYLGGAHAHGKVRIASKEYIQTSDFVNIAAYQTPVSTLDVVHDNSTFSTMSAGTAGGEVIRFGEKHSTYSAGKLVQLRSGTWYPSNATDTTFQGSMLGIALGNSPLVEGVLIRGFAKLNTNSDDVTTWTTGSPLYVSENVAGGITEVAPSNTTEYVRVVGYMTETANVVYFNPDGTFIKIA